MSTAVHGIWLCKPAASILRFDGELRAGVAAKGARTTRFALALAGGRDDGGRFSASDDCGDGDGDNAGWRADGAGDVNFGGVDGGSTPSLDLDTTGEEASPRGDDASSGWGVPADSRR